ncbi:MAG TPA: glycoside hydrolase family 15 protein [Acidimicrobiales bacterium]|nr:glycoside hydrolase family 15 protein [Acidimicrobiales bacterium]
MITASSAVPLAARTWLGDGVGGATVAADGTVDWCCPWALQGPAACSALLDPLGGALRVGPARPPGTPGVGVAVASGRLGYVSGTNVSTVVLEAAGGRRVEVVDLLPWTAAGPVGGGGRLVRVVRALSGPVDVEVEYRPPLRPAPPRRVASAPWGVVADRVAVRAGVPLVAVPVGRHGTVWRGQVRLDVGEVVVVTLGALTDEPLAPDAALRLVDETVGAWRWWAAPATAALEGPYAAAALRALLGVRALTGAYGAPLAAGTTSLPRWVGAERTADDRFVRLRHAATAARLLRRVGLDDDAVAAEQWLRAAVEAAPTPWAPVLAADASAPPGQEEVPLQGWRRSGPVVRGRDDGPDLGAVGDVVAAVSASTGGDDRSGAVGGPAAGPLTGAWPALAAAADDLAERWQQPDAGLWGAGGPLRPWTSSRLRTWAGLDRMARLARAADPLSLDAVGWQQAARQVLGALERSSLAADGGLALAAQPGGPGADWPDAALVQVAWSGPWPRAHPVVAATVDRVLERLTEGPWVRRYPPDVDDGIAGGDGADVEATCWAVRAEAALGRWESAHERMERVTGALGAGTGVVAAAVDPLSGQLLGDLPATGAALALVEAALALAAGPT